MDIGEKFSKFPLETDTIEASFEDDLADISYFHRGQMMNLYKNNLQKRIALYAPFLDLLKKNSDSRLTSNKNYQNFLKEIDKKDLSDDSPEEFGLNDLQLEETINIIKDLIFISETSSKTMGQAA